MCVCLGQGKHTRTGTGQSEPRPRAGPAPAWRCYPGSQPQSALVAIQWAIRLCTAQGIQFQGHHSHPGVYNYESLGWAGSSSPVAASSGNGGYPSRRTPGNPLAMPPAQPPPTWGAQACPPLPYAAGTLEHPKSLPLREPLSPAPAPVGTRPQCAPTSWTRLGHRCQATQHASLITFWRSVPFPEASSASSPRFREWLPADAHSRWALLVSGGPEGRVCLSCQKPPADKASCPS